MALNLQVGTIIQPGSDGVHSVSLPANFDPMALIVWCSPATADGVVDADANFSMGMATDRGGTPQMRYFTYGSDDTAAYAVTARGGGSGALLKLYSTYTVTPTVDLEVDFSSFTAGASSAFDLDWVNRYTTASIRVHYLVLGGSDITDALVDDITLSTAVATQDETVVASFGQPDLLIFMGSGASFSDAGVNARMMIGVAKSDTERFCTAFHETDASGTMSLGAINKARAILSFASASTLDAECDLSAKASWPTDGFQLTFTDQAAAATPFGYLALKGTFTSKVTSINSPTSIGDVDVDHGSVPEGALLFTTSGPGTTSTIDSTSAILGVFGMGAYDGATEAYAGAGNDDGDTLADTSIFNTTAKVMQIGETDTTGSVLAECDGVITGNTFRTSWTTVDASAHTVGVLTLGSGAGAAATSLIYQPAPPSLYGR